MNPRSLRKLFAAGKAPSAKSLLGKNGSTAEWRVNMLTGMIPDMGGWPTHHRKLFAKTSEDIRGCNIIFDNHRWGSFRLREDIDGSLLIDYDVPENGKLSSRIRDYVRTTPNPDVLIGKFHLRWRGNEILGYYFTLTREKSASRWPQ